VLAADDGGGAVAEGLGHDYSDSAVFRAKRISRVAPSRRRSIDVA
jgi:hypothetical protein